ncbi:MAG: GGDEF domain-containing protein [Anaerolineae bacterium]|nr:GGDEF domain-containing protein [Anaerolineae bacterium]
MQTVFNQKIFQTILLAGFILVIVAIVIQLPLQPVGYAFYDWDMAYNGKNEGITLPLNEAIQPGISLMTLTTTFPAVPGDTIVLPRVSGNAVEVILNGKTVYKLGDFNAPTANLWNSQLFVMLPEPLLPENRLTLHIASSIVSTGMSAVPYLTSFPEASQRVMLLDWIFNALPMMTSGAACIMGLILLISCYLRRQWVNANFFIGIALLFCVGFAYDTYFRSSSGSLLQFLWTIKTIVICGYCAGLALMCGLEVYIWKRLKVSLWAAAAVFCASLLLLAAPDLYWFTLFNQVGTALFFIIMLVFCWMVFKAPQQSGWLHLIALLTVIGLLQQIYELVFYSALPNLMPYVITLSTLTIGINLILEYNRILDENILLRHTNNLDPLTGVLNRRVVKEINNRVYHYAVLIDLNDFKELNDRHGHMVGDEVLINFTNICRRNLRQDDLIIRWGGDEFLLVFAHISQNESGYQIVDNIIQRIKLQFSEADHNLNLSFSYGIQTLQDSFEQSIREADRLMYAMKETHKKEFAGKSEPSVNGFPPFNNQKE